MSLTEKQKRFIDEYMIDLCATNAAKRAGYSQRTSNEQGSQLLRNAKVAREIELRKSLRKKKFEGMEELILRELCNIAFCNIQEIHNSIKSGSKNENKQVNAIKTMSVGPSGISFSVHDKLKALEMLSDHFGLNQKANEEPKTDLAQTVSEALERWKRMRGGK